MENNAKMAEQPDRRSIKPIAPREYYVYFRHYIGERVNITGLDYYGVVTALHVNCTGGNEYCVDNGTTERWYPESMLTEEYYIMPDPPPLPGPGPCRGDESTDHAVDKR